MWHADKPFSLVLEGATRQVKAVKLCSFMTKNSSSSTTRNPQWGCRQLSKNCHGSSDGKTEQGWEKIPQGFPARRPFPSAYVFAQLLHNSLHSSLPLCTDKCAKVSCLSKLSSSWTFGCRDKTFHGLFCLHLLAFSGSWLLQDSLGLHEAKESSGNSLLYHSWSPKFLS